MKKTLKKLLSLLDFPKSKWLKFLLNNFFIKSIKKKKRNWIIICIIGFLIYKRRKNRRIRAFYQKNSENERIMKKLNPVIKSYNPTFYLPFGFMKTVFAGLTNSKVLGGYRRTELELSDGEVIALDFYPKNYHRGRKDIPVVIFIPGIFGDSTDLYCMELAQTVEKKLGWATCIYNRRGYGSMPYRVKVL